MNRFHRYIASLMMVIVYLTIVFSPLAPIAMKSKLVAHALTGQCSGDCRIDGCSVERSAAHDCCCWQNRNKTDLASKSARPSGGCCSVKHDATLPKMVASCCAPRNHAEHEEGESVTSASEESSSDDGPARVTISGRTCGSGKFFALLGMENIQHLPSNFVRIAPIQMEILTSSTMHERLTSRHGDPPDPPPKFFCLS